MVKDAVSEGDDVWLPCVSGTLAVWVEIAVRDCDGDWESVVVVV